MIYHAPSIIGLEIKFFHIDKKSYGESRTQFFIDTNQGKVSS